MLTVVGEIVESEVHTYQDRRTHRPAYRLDTTLSDRRTGAADVVLRPEASTSATGTPNGSPVGRRGIFIGQVSTFRRRVAADQPDDGALRSESTRPRRDGRCRGRLDQGALPALPADQGRRLVGPAARHRVRARRSSTTCPTRCPQTCAREHDLPDLMTALRARPRARLVGPRCTAAQRRFRFDEALVTQLVLARRRAALAAARRPGTCAAAGACSPPSTQRLPFTLTAGQEQVSAEILDDLARPHPMNRLLQGEVGLRQDAGRAAGDAAGRRLRWAGRAARADRGARPAAPPLDHGDARRPRRRRHARRRRRGAPGSCS